MKLGKEQKKVEFLVDTGTMYSVLNKALMPLGNGYVMVEGATGQSEKAYFCEPLKHKLGQETRPGLSPSLRLSCAYELSQERRKD